MSTQSLPNLDLIRSHFPVLSGDTILLENAGGSQVPVVVADAIRDYMLDTYVQLDASYGLSEHCTRVVNDAHAFVNTLMNGTGIGEVILGPSCSALCAMLARCYADVLPADAEIIIAETGHEANVGPWVGLEKRGFTVKTWRVDPETQGCPIDQLERLLTERTAIVAFPHVSNLLGEIVDVPRITKLVHDAGARVVVDGVAYAPHRAIDVAAWDVDWYVYSTYKVYGPHMGALYGRADAIAELTGPNHFFIPREEVPYKFELGGVCHEGCAGVLALGAYLNEINGNAADAPVDRGTVVEAFDVMAACERPLQERLVEWVLSKPQLRMVGPAHGGPSRVGTISFVHDSMSSKRISDEVNRRGIGIRHGHMYAHRLCAALGIEPDDGVVRVSFVHYNVVDEIERLVSVLESVI